jgi:hypothetical protein
MYLLGTPFATYAENAYMKKWLLALFIATSLVISPSCKEKSEHKADKKNVISTSDVPDIVKTAFTTKYPGATDVIWEDAHEGDSPTFKVKFKREDKYWKAEFKSDGSFVKDGED